jgi:hypothetical protein
VLDAELSDLLQIVGATAGRQRGPGGNASLAAATAATASSALLWGTRAHTSPVAGSPESLDAPEAAPRT